MIGRDDIADTLAAEAVETVPQMREASALLEHWDGIRFGMLAPEVQRQKLQFEVLVDIRDHLQTIATSLEVIASANEAGK